MVDLLNRFLRDESGATVIEYAILAVMIGAALVAGLSVVGDTLGATFEGLAEAIKRSGSYNR